MSKSTQSDKGDKLWAIMAVVSGLGAAKVTNKLLSTGWKASTGRKPPANPADPDVPIGGEEANVTVRTWGEILPKDVPLEGEVGADATSDAATWARKPHWELGETLDIIDNPRGAKIAGSDFPVYKGAGSALQH